MEEKREVEVQSLKKGNFAFIRSQPCRITEVTKKPKASVKGNERIYIVGKKIQITQVNLCQKLLFLHQLTHNMTTDCSLNYKFST